MSRSQGSGNSGTDSSTLSGDTSTDENDPGKIVRSHLPSPAYWSAFDDPPSIYYSPFGPRESRRMIIIRRVDMSLRLILRRRIKYYINCVVVLVDRSSIRGPITTIQTTSSRRKIRVLITKTCTEGGRLERVQLGRQLLQLQLRRNVQPNHLLRWSCPLQSRKTSKSPLRSRPTLISLLQSRSLFNSPFKSRPASKPRRRTTQFSNLFNVEIDEEVSRETSVIHRKVSHSNQNPGFRCFFRNGQKRRFHGTDFLHATDQEGRRNSQFFPPKPEKHQSVVPFVFRALLGSQDILEMVF